MRSEDPALQSAVAWAGADRCQAVLVVSSTSVTTTAEGAAVSRSLARCRLHTRSFKALWNVSAASVLSNSKSMVTCD